MMDEATAAFVGRLTTIDPALRTAYDDVIAYWEPDAPPVTTLFAELGQHIAEGYAADAVVPSSILDEIERAMAGADDMLRTAVATGLIEGMVGRAKRIRRWDEIRPLLGAMSAAHADAWA